MMKSCPNCHAKFPDDITFCLNDGFTLVDENDFENEKTLSYSANPTMQNQGRLTVDYDQQFFQPPSSDYSQVPKQGLQPIVIMGGVLGLCLLMIGIVSAGAVYLINKPVKYPTPTPRIYPTPDQTPYKGGMHQETVSLKVEPAGKVKGSFGKQFLKFMVTNPSEKIVALPNLSVTLYQGDVKVGGAFGESNLKYLKPGQTVPIWVDLGFGNVKYTEAKTETSLTAKVVNKSKEEIFPQLTISDTKMEVSKGTSSFNDYTYTENWYQVTGIVENTNYETISAEVVVVFYDADSNIVGIDQTFLSNLKRGEKQKVEAGAGEISSLFGKPKRFEIIVTDRRTF